ncbi:MAG: LytTR family DNA-binding domain-containing protein, partial [Bacteroidota bacterium]
VTNMNTPVASKTRTTRILNSVIREKQFLPSFNGPNFITKIGLPDADNILRMIRIEDIIFMESRGNVTNVSVQGEAKRFTVFDSLKSFEQRLEYFNFFRTHRSFLVNLNKIKLYNYRKDKGRKVKLENDCYIPVSDDRKHDLKKKLQLL